MDSSNDLSLQLNVNRLSGHLPSSLNLIGYLNILQGNMYSCNNMGDSMTPTNDIHYDTYACGSEFLNTALLTFVTVTSVVITLLLYFQSHFQKQIVSIVLRLRAQLFGYLMYPISPHLKLISGVNSVFELFRMIYSILYDCSSYLHCIFNMLFEL